MRHAGGPGAALVPLESSKDETWTKQVEVNYKVYLVYF